MAKTACCTSVSASALSSVSFSVQAAFARLLAEPEDRFLTGLVVVVFAGDVDQELTAASLSSLIEAAKMICSLTSRW